MLLFSSCYSADSHDYDVIITCSDIEHITALHKTIPTIEIALLKPKGNVSGSVYTCTCTHVQHVQVKVCGVVVGVGVGGGWRCHIQCCKPVRVVLCTLGWSEL